MAPLLKGAGLRQGSLVSNIAILRDTCNAQITQTLSAVKTEGSSAPTLPLLPSLSKHRILFISGGASPSRCPDYFHFHKHRHSRTILRPALSLFKFTANGGHHNYSLFIIHYSLNKKSASFQTTDLDIKFQCKIKVCRPPVTEVKQPADP